MDFSTLRADFVLGLDLSPRATGYHKITSAGPVSGTMDTEHLNHFERMDAVLAKVTELTQKGQTLVVIEDFAHAVGFRAHQLGGLGYFIRHSLWKRGIPFVIVGTQQLKKFATGYSKSEKSTIVMHVYKRWGLEAATDDEADATVLAHIGMCLLGLEQPTMQAQREVLAALTAGKQKKKKKAAA